MCFQRAQPHRLSCQVLLLSDPFDLLILCSVSVLDMAGLSVPSDYGLAGGSLLALANGKGDPNRKDFVTAQYHSVFSVTGEFMLRQGDYKLITCKPAYQ